MMKDWEYKELDEVMRSNYQRFLSDDGKGRKHAVVRTATEFDNMGRIEDVIVDVVIGELMIENGEGLECDITAISKRLAIFDVMSAEDELTKEECEDLSNRIKNVLDGLKTVTVDYSNRV